MIVNFGKSQSSISFPEIPDHTCHIVVVCNVRLDHHSAVVTSVAVYPPRTSVGGGCDEMMTTSGTRGWGHVGILIEYKESY